MVNKIESHVQCAVVKISCKFGQNLSIGYRVTLQTNNKHMHVAENITSLVRVRNDKILTVPFWTPIFVWIVH